MKTERKREREREKTEIQSRNKESIQSVAALGDAWKTIKKSCYNPSVTFLVIL